MLLSHFDIFLSKYGDKYDSQYRDTRHRLRALVDYLDTKQVIWYELDLMKYRQYLSEERALAPHSVNVYLAAVRTAYRELLEDEDELRILLKQYPEMLDGEDVEIALETIAIIADSSTASKKVERPKAQHHWYTIEQVEHLLNSIDTSSLKGVRDLAILSLLFATGIRDTELVSLQVSDLYHKVNDISALRVPDCLQCVERSVGYYGMEWVIPVTETWLKKANIQQSFIFRGVTQKGEIRQNGLSSRAVYDILRQYPIVVDGKPEPLQMLNIRYMYSRTLYKAGIPIDTIRQNLGFDSDITAMQYIGKLDKPDEKPKLYKLIVKQ